MKNQLQQLTQRILAGEDLNRDEARFLVSADCDLAPLLHGATQLREHFFNNFIHRCAIVNARSGGCSEDCAFAPRAAITKPAARFYPLLSRDHLIEEAKKARANGINCFGIVTSGRAASDAEIGVIVEVLTACASLGIPSLGASPGILTGHQLKRLKAAGLRHYNHNLETSRAFYPKICTTHTWEARYQTLRDAKAVGLEICSGGIFGLGECWDDRIDLGLTLQELDIRNVPLNFLSAIPGTPLADQPTISADEGLRIIALFRFLLPRATIRICGGRPATFSGRQAEIFTAGASGILTGDYLTTSGNTVKSDRQLITTAGLRCASDDCAR